MSDYTLYTYFRSSCSARLRIALNLKNQSYELVPVNLLKSEQLGDAHKSLNPSGTVPLLVCHKASDLKITQSVAGLEYLEEAHPSENGLLPPSSDPEKRAYVRILANIIACDVQPVTNLRIIRRVKALNGDVDTWMKELMIEGLSAYEAVVKESKWKGQYSVGDNITVADCCLIPAVWNAERYNVDMSSFTEIVRISNALKAHPAVKKASYFVQPDTPDELREQ